MFSYSFCRKDAVRALSTGEISTALRPFYFTVHPDLFGQYPTQRVNIFFNYDKTYYRQFIKIKFLKYK